MKHLQTNPIRVLIVDDSALMRSLLGKIINRQPDMVAVGAACDAAVARAMIRTLNPDVLTLDVEMPGLSGLDFLEKLMRLRPMPVVMVSTTTQQGAEASLRALALGAVDFVAKPKADVLLGLEASADELVEKIHAAAMARVRKFVPPKPIGTKQAAVKPAMLGSTEMLVVIGASTGGPEAIQVVLQQLPPDAPAILITQHMPPGFTHSFARRLDSLCSIRVKEAVAGEQVQRGHAYIAPGGRHLLVEKKGTAVFTALSDAAPVHRHRPSVEMLFHSAARCAGPGVIGVMLTGMGNDGATAMLELQQAGAFTVAQDEASCVVFGMPGQAIAAGGVDEVLPLERIAARVLERVRYTGLSRLRSAPVVAPRVVRSTSRPDAAKPQFLRRSADE